MGLIHLNTAETDAFFEKQGGFFKHDLVDHPLLQEESLRALIRRLPEKQVMLSQGKKSEKTDFDRAHIELKNKLSAADAIDNIEDSNASFMIRSPETDKAYESLFHDLVADAKAFCNRSGLQLKAPLLYMFISSPNAITPYHVDRYSTFLMQIKGSKTCYQWPAFNYDITTPEELEIFFAKSGRGPQLKEAFESSRVSYDMVPGEGLHIPFIAPHAVKNGPNVSVSLSIIFYTNQTQKVANIFRFNHQARNKLRMKPRPPGSNDFVDSSKNFYIRLRDKLAS